MDRLYAKERRQLGRFRDTLSHVGADSRKFKHCMVGRARPNW